MLPAAYYGPIEGLTYMTARKRRTRSGSTPREIAVRGIRRKQLDQDKLAMALFMLGENIVRDRHEQTRPAVAEPSAASYSKTSMSTNILDDRTGVILERIEDQLAAILEGQAAMAGVPAQIERLDNRVANVETDVKAIKAAVKDHTDEQRRHATQLEDHEGRLTHLEQAA